MFSPYNRHGEYVTLAYARFATTHADYAIAMLLTLAIRHATVLLPCAIATMPLRC